MLRGFVVQQAFTSGLNHLFARSPGAQDALAPHFGKTLAIDLTLLRIQMKITEGGELAVAGGDTTDATVSLPFGLLAQLPFKGKAVFRDAPTAGDAELLAAFNDAFAQLDIDAEAELANLFGPVAGFRLAESGRAFGNWLSQAASDTARAFAEYAVEETVMLARPGDVDRFNREVDTLRDDTERLQARLSRLEKTE